MPGTVFKGSISFGLVSVPIRLYTATEEKSPGLHMVHIEDQGRVRYKKVCELDGEELQKDDIAKGYESADGRTAVLTNDDMKHLPLPSKNTVEVLEFTDADQIDPVMLGRSYLAEADPKAPGKPYVLLREALADSGQVGIVRVALRGREHLALLRADGQLLVVQLLVWPDEVRDPGELHLPDDTVRAQEKQMARSLIDTMTHDFDAEQYEDHYREALTELVEAKLEGAPLPEEPESDGGGKVLDLMAALQASVEARGTGSGSGNKTAAGKSTTKKTTAKKAPAKKAAAKKQASAKKAAPAKKSASAKKTASAKKAPAKKTASKKTTAARTTKKASGTRRAA